MSNIFKIILFCAQVFLLKSISAQCIEAPYGVASPWGLMSPFLRNPWRFPTYRAPWWTPSYTPAPAATDAPTKPCRTGFISSPADLAASKGGGFMVSCSSPMPLTGISVSCKNVIEGVVKVEGEMPFLGSAFVKGPVRTCGDGEVTYTCGCGEVAMIDENIL